MRKAFALSVMLLAGIAFVPSAQAAASSVEAQEMRTMMQPRVRRQVIGVNRRGRVRTVTTTRVTGRGRNRVRETIQTTYHRNGATSVRVLRRVRLG